MRKTAAVIACMILAGAISCTDNGRGEASGQYLPDLNALFERYNTLDSLGKHGELAALILDENRDLQASELYVVAAWAYEEAGSPDSVVACLHRAIDRGMANPNILDKFAPLKATGPDMDYLQARLDSISRALHRVSHFGMELRSMEAFWPHFQRALADTATARDALRDFVLEGPPEIRDFYVVRYGSVDQMYGQMINGAPDYYRYLRERFSPDSVLALKEKTTRWMERFREIYPQAVFPKVYVVPGILNSGGTTTEMGLFVGGDMYGRSDDMPTDQLNDWQKGAIMNFSDLPGLTLHELMHFQQNYRDSLQAETLLAGVIGEGVCDFLAELASGEPLENENLRYLEAPENRERIFADLSRELFGTDNSKWLYNGGSIDDRPHDLGYTVGYLICKSYYENQKDKIRAVQQLLGTDDFASIVGGSDYAYLLTGRGEPESKPL